jgi:dCMP deaminase
LRRSLKAHDADKYNYCLSSHAEVNAIDQAARFGIPLEGAALYTTLEPCNWCFKQLIQAGIKEIYFEESYDSKNKDFDVYWRKIMESHEGIRVFQQVTLSEEAKRMVVDTLMGGSTRLMTATDPDQECAPDPDALRAALEEK